MKPYPTPVTDAALSNQTLPQAMGYVRAKVSQDLEQKLATANDMIAHLQRENGLVEFYRCQDRIKELEERDTAHREMARLQLSRISDERDSLLTALREVVEGRHGAPVRAKKLLDQLQGPSRRRLD